jgi:hypothetical protein
MKIICALLVCLLSVLFITTSSNAFEFSADSVFTMEGRKMHGKMFAKTDKFRMEMKSPQPMIMITRADKKLVWSIMPSERMYMEMKFNPEQAPKTKIRGEVDRKLVGKETIDGHPTEKYLITYKSGERTHTVYQWWATDLKFPIKTADPENKWVQEYKNIKLGSQPDSLFELPSGYSKFDMPAMPGGMPGGGMPRGGMNFR